MSWDFWGKECVGAPQQPLGFATMLNMWNHAGCIESNSLHRHPQMFFAIGFDFVTTSLLDRQAHVSSEHFLGFISCGLMVHCDNFLCNVFHVYSI